MDFAQKVRGNVNLGGINPILPIIVGQDNISYSVHIKAKDPWNVLLGGAWVPDRRWSIALESSAASSTASPRLELWSTAFEMR